MTKIIINACDETPMPLASELVWRTLAENNLKATKRGTLCAAVYSINNNDYAVYVHATQKGTLVFNVEKI